MRKTVFLSLVVVLILAACSSPSAQPAHTTAPTAAASEPTSPPAAAYELNVRVTGPDNAPIGWASGTIQGAGNASADAEGQLAWKNLTSSGGSLTVTAQGYVATQQSLSLSAGRNELSIVLQPDPFQLNPLTACQPGQKIVYVEDFEKDQALNMNIAVGTNWSYMDVNNRGTVLSFNAPGASEIAKVSTEFGNAVWQFDLKTPGAIDINFIWHVSETVEGTNPGLSRYFVSYQPGTFFSLSFERPGENGKLAEAETTAYSQDEWHTFALAYYKGAISVWVDGELAMETNHETPIEKGQFGFEIKPSTQAEILFDNLIVCGLEGPYTPPSAP